MSMEMTDVVVSAPGKIILHGEHAVVYGKIAIAAALNLRSYLRIKTNHSGQVSVNLPNIDVKGSWKVADFKNGLKLPLCDPLKPVAITDDTLTILKSIGGIDHHTNSTKDLALIAFLYLYTCIAFESNVPGIEVVVSSNLPVSAGLGSSAGYSVCLAASFLQYCNYISPKQNGGQVIWSDEDLKLINSWAFQAEKIIHGNPSGIDNSISSYGGAIKFQDGQITPVGKMPKLRILLVNTKVPRSTKTLVAGVRERCVKLKDVMEPILNSTESIAVKCLTVLQEMNDNPSPQHYSILQELIDINQHLLEAMGVSHPSISNIIRITAENQLYTKLTGAGGGGCAFTLIPPGTEEEKINNIKKALEKLGYDYWETSIGATGVTPHQIDDKQLPEHLL